MKEKRKRINRKWPCFLAVSLLLILIFLAAGKIKKGYHGDEFFTFILANHTYSDTNSIFVQVKDETSYTGKELWDEFLYVNDGNRFDYKNVWENQIHDVHPPLYYVIVHTVSSIFPGLSVKKTGIMVNALLGVVVFWQMVRIFELLRLKRRNAVILAAAFILSCGFIDYAVMFIRMYALLAVWMNLLILVFLRYPPEDKSGTPYYLLFGAALIGGMLTQYYFIIFAFFTCLLYAGYVIKNRNWKKLIASLATAGISFLIAYLIFPSMIDHIFFGTRGQQAFENVSSSGLIRNLWIFIDQINVNIFGGLLVVLLAILFCLAIVLSGKNEKADMYPGPLLIIPVILYVIVVAKIAPYQTLRYCISCMGVLYAGVMGLLIGMADRVSKTAYRYVLVLAILMLFTGYRKEPVNMYADEEAKCSMIQTNAALPCAYIYDFQGYIMLNYPELWYLNDIVFVNAGKWEEEKSSITKEGSLLLFIDDKKTDMLAAVTEQTGHTKSEYLFTSGHAKVYILS